MCTLSASGEGSRAYYHAAFCGLETDVAEFVQIFVILFVLTHGMKRREGVPLLLTARFHWINTCRRRTETVNAQMLRLCFAQEESLHQRKMPAHTQRQRLNSALPVMPRAIFIIMNLGWIELDKLVTFEYAWWRHYIITRGFSKESGRLGAEGNPSHTLWTWGT